MINTHYVVCYTQNNMYDLNYFNYFSVLYVCPFLHTLHAMKILICTVIHLIINVRIFPVRNIPPPKGL